MKTAVYLAAIVVLVSVCPQVRANDFKPVLAEMGDIDPDRAAPTFSVEKVLDEKTSRARSTPDRSLRIYEVDVLLEGFGRIRLGNYHVAGPDREGRVRGGGGVDEASAQVGWLKGAPDLALLVWREEYIGGSASCCYFRSAVLRLAKGGASVLLRASGRVTYATRHLSYDIGLSEDHFAYDANTRTLTNRVSRYTKIWSARRGGLYVAEAHWHGEGALAIIRETIIHTCKYGDGKLVSDSIELFHQSQKGVRLKDVAQFYLGPLAPREVLLEANPELAARYKDQHPGAYIYLPEDTLVRIPVPQEWLRKRSARPVGP